MRPHTSRLGASGARAFSLIEIVSTLIILALLATIGVGKYIDYSVRARQSAEAAVVRSVQAGLSQFRVNTSLRGQSGAFPSTLDPIAANESAAPNTAFFSHVLSTPITRDWRKGSTLNTYIGPTGTTYTYDPSTGQFSDQVVVAAGTPGALQSGNAPGFTSFTSTTTWNASMAPLSGTSQVFATGYTMAADGSLSLTDAAGFTENARRVAITGQIIDTGTWTLSLDTNLTEYWNQLNYWQVYAVNDTANLTLQGNTLNWGTAPSGAKLLARNYAPENQDGGQWFNYTDTFTVSAQDARDYTQLVVVMAGSANGGQILGWDNVALTKR